MTTISRRQFLQSTAGLALVGTTSFGVKKNRPLLSFSTLGCPDWTFHQVVAFAAQHRYNGLEIRGIQRELDLPKCKEFNTPEAIAATRRLLKEAGLKIINLGSSAALHHGPGAEREKHLDEAKRFIDLSDALSCPYIRVFPNDFPKDQDREATIERIVSGLLTLGNHAKGSKVTVLMESHGQVVYTADLERIMTAAAHAHVGLVWDIVNMWAVTKEPPAMAYGKLKKFIRHTHIKDLNLVNGKEQYMLLGRGETPVFEGIDALRKDGYNGYYSFEWEKLWHPEIAEPETALADYAAVMQRHFTTPRHTSTNRVS
jgi:sugar phosphate isomerase/epimerase